MHLHIWSPHRSFIGLSGLDLYGQHHHGPVPHTRNQAIYMPDGDAFVMQPVIIGHHISSGGIVTFPSRIIIETSLSMYPRAVAMGIHKVTYAENIG